MNRSSEEIKARCNCILNDEKIISLVKTSSSPSAAYEMVFAETKDISKAKAGRWLAVLRRDFPDDFRKLNLTILRHVSNDTAQKGKEEGHENYGNEPRKSRTDISH